MIRHIFHGFSFFIIFISQKQTIVLDTRYTYVVIDATKLILTQNAYNE